MKQLIHSLVCLLYKKHNKTPSDLLLSSLYKYDIRSENVEVNIEHLVTKLKSKSYNAYMIFTTLNMSPHIIYLVYVLTHINSIRIYIPIKKIALGLLTDIEQYKNCIDVHLYSIVLEVHYNYNLYLQFKNHNNLLYKEYEQYVLTLQDDVLTFYAKMYKMFVRMKCCINEREEQEYKKEEIPEICKKYLEYCNSSSKCVGSYGSIRGSSKNGSISSSDNCKSTDNNKSIGNSMIGGNSIICGNSKRSESTSGSSHYNNKLHGNIHDNNLPNHTSHDNNLHNKLHDTPHDNVLLLCSRNVSYTDMSHYNTLIYNDILHKQDIRKQLEIFKQIFLGKRSDFIENLFFNLKKMKKKTNVSYTYILQETVNTIFNENYNIEIILGSSDKTSFNLFYNVHTPLSFVFEKEYICKLSKVFKFLYKCKKIEYLTRKCKNMVYSMFIRRMYFYMSMDVFDKYYTFDDMFTRIEKVLQISGSVDGTSSNDKCTSSNDKCTSSNDKCTSSNDKCTSSNDKCTSSNDKCTSSNDKCTSSSNNDINDKCTGNGKCSHGRNGQYISNHMHNINDYNNNDHINHMHNKDVLPPCGVEGNNTLQSIHNLTGVSALGVRDSKNVNILEYIQRALHKNIDTILEKVYLDTDRLYQILKDLEVLLMEHITKGIVFNDTHIRERIHELYVMTENDIFILSA